MTREETLQGAITICQSTEGQDTTPLEAFAAAGWEVVFRFFGEAGPVKVWEDPAVTSYNASLRGDYARDMGHVFNGLYRGRNQGEKRDLIRAAHYSPEAEARYLAEVPDSWQDPALYYIGGKMGNTVRAAIFAPGEKPNNPFLWG